MERETAEKEVLMAEKAEIEAKERIKKQPVRCPKCKEYSVIEDDGQRPLMIECVHCGANGYISAKPKMLSEPKLPEDEKEKLIIQCPKCDEMFTVDDEVGEIVCPSCGVRGQLDEETLEELRKEQDSEGSEPAGKKEEKPAEEKPEKPEKTLRCPNCETKFSIPADAERIECPSCGVSGTL
jgi:DNA-directed RNA polymerase subunit RPC12/RpoP